MAKPDLSDYITVNERIVAFKARFPDGSLQSEIVELTADRVTIKAYAYRDPGDPRPGIGHSSMNIPGKTSFTRDSEIENAESSAWGRAIAALGFEVKHSIASADEVSNKVDDEDLGVCPEHDEPWTRSPKTGKVGHPVHNEQGRLVACIKEDQ